MRPALCAYPIPTIFQKKDKENSTQGEGNNRSKLLKSQLAHFGIGNNFVKSTN